MTTIIEKLAQLETLEKELLGEKRLYRVFYNVKRPYERDYINSDRRTIKDVSVQVTDVVAYENEDSDTFQIIPTEKVIKLLQSGGRLSVYRGDIYIEIPNSSRLETDDEYNERIATEKLEYDKRYEKDYAAWTAYAAHKSRIQTLETKIADLTADIERELENPEVVETVNHYLANLESCLKVN